MKARHALPVVLCVLAAAVPPARGQETPSATPADFNGTWRYASSASHGRQVIERGIERAIDGMNFITQPIARGRLRDKNPLVRRFDITLTDADCRVVNDGSRTYRGRLGQWTEHRFDGETIRVQFLHRVDAIVQLFRTDSGTRRNVFRIRSDGRMRLEVTVQAGSLPRDMHYQLDYRR